MYNISYFSTTKKKSRMWKFATILCVTLFISTRVGLAEGFDSRHVIRSIDDVKQQIDQKSYEVQERAFGFGENANDELGEYTHTVNREIQEATEKVQNEVSKVLGNALDTIKEECNVFAAALQDEARKVQENVRDSLLSAVTVGARHLSAVFHHASNGKEQLSKQKTRATSCSSDDCNEILNQVYSIGNKTIAQIATGYEMYVNAIGNNDLVVKYINKDETGYQKFLNKLSTVVDKIEECIARKVNVE